MKVTKRELLRRIEALEKWSEGADNMLTELNHALPDPEQEKRLDQSVFNGLDEKWRFAAVDSKGGAFLFSEKPSFSKLCIGFWFSAGAFGCKSVGYGYDPTNWQNSLIERETIELSGSELCKAMLDRGDKYIMCFTSCTSDDSAILKGRVETVISEAESTRWDFETFDDLVIYAVPINNQGEPLTAAEAGL